MATRNERKRKAKLRKQELDNQFKQAWIDYKRNCIVRENLGKGHRKSGDEGFTSSVALVAQGRQSGGRAQAQWGYNQATRRKIERVKG